MQNGVPVDADADTDGPNKFLLTAAEMKHFTACEHDMVLIVDLATSAHRKRQPTVL